MGTVGVAEVLKSALAYAERGWPVLALYGIREGKCTCKAGEKCDDTGKHPRINDWIKEASTDPGVIKKWFSRWPDSNLGILTGAKSGLVALDVDPRNGGTDSLHDVEAEHGTLPSTVESVTGGGGRHILFAHPGGTLPKKIGIRPGLDLCADGAQIVAPPSLHRSGYRYAWELDHHPDDVAVALLPGWLIKLAKHHEKPPLLRVVTGSTIPKGRRNASLASLAGTMRRRGMSQQSIDAALQAENQARCEEPLAAAEISNIATSIARYPPEPAKVQDKLPEVFVTGGHTDDDEKYFEVGTDRFVDDLVLVMPPGAVYQRGSLVGTLDGDQGCLRFKEATDARLRMIVDEHVRLVKWVKPKDRERVKVYQPCRIDHARLLREGASVSSSVRHLEELVPYPVFVESGFKRVTPGWNADAKTYYDEPSSLQGVRPITDVRRIRAILDDLVVDFPFKDKASKENYFGLLLTPILRPAMPGANTPLHIITSSLERTGKGKLGCETLGGVILGRPAPVMPWAGSEEERDKRVISMLVRGDTISVIDNLDASEVLDSAVLSTLLTGPVYRGRVLGSNRMVDLPNTLTLVATGNNVRCSSEIAKRAVPIVLQPATDHPETRSDFRHPDLAAHIHRVRVEVLGALLGMVENWKKKQSRREWTMGGFERWSKVVGAVLHENGFTNWMANWPEWLRKTDPDGEDLRTFVEAWARRWADEKKSPRDLLVLVNELGVFPWIQKAKDERGALVSLAKSVLRRHESQPVGEWIIRASGSGSTSFYYLETM